jgi:hypothetical protein
MRTRLVGLAVLALLATGCAGALEGLAPRYFYGNVVEIGGEELCLADVRDDEPDRTRCFALSAVVVPDEVREGDLVVVRYRPEGEERDVALDLRLVEDR